MRLTSEIIRMQRLAGIISENQFSDMNTEVKISDVDLDVIEDLPQVKMAADIIADNPESLAKLERFAAMAGVDFSLNESAETSYLDVQKIADFIEDMINGESLEEGEEEGEEREGEKKEKSNLMLTAASIGSMLPFIPGISGLFSQASEATGIPMMALGAGSVIAAAIVGAIISNIKKKREEKRKL